MKSNSFSQGNPRAWRNPWVIGWITLIVIVLGVNAFMISMAYITNPGLVSKDYYERGRDHEKNIDKKLAARKALGWTINTQFPDEPVMQRSERYRFSTVDSKGLPLNGATVFLHAYRPADSTQDFKLSMGETTPGFYEANVNFPLKGLWVLTIHLQKGDDVYNFTKRISVLTQ